MQKNKRILYIDFIRIVSILFVLFIHTTSIDMANNASGINLKVLTILNIFVRPAVPLFFMISGALLLSRDNTLSLTYTWKKRIPKIVIPFIAWSVISLIVIRLHAHETTNFIKPILAIYHQPISGTLWFMYPLIAIYLISPLLKAFVDNISKTTFIYTLVIWFIFSSLLPTLSTFIPSVYASYLIGYSTGSLLFISGYVGYFLLGYFLVKYKFPYKKYYWLLLILIIGFISFIQIFLTNKLVRISQNITHYVASAFIVILSVLLFLILKHVGEKINSNHATKIISFFAPLVFGMYLMHNLFILVLDPYLINILPTNNLFSVFIRYFVVILVSAVAAWIISKIPKLRYILLGLK